MFNWMCSKYSSRRSAIFPASIYLFKGNNGNTRTNCKIYLQLAIKTPKRHQNDINDTDFRHCCVSIVD